MVTSPLRKLKTIKAAGLFSRSAIGTCCINFVMQRIFRISSRFRYQIHFSSKVTTPTKVILLGEGSNVIKCLALNGGIYIQGSNGVDLHRSVLIAPGVKIISGNHNIHNFDAPSVQTTKIEIMEDCWLGANAVILPGVILLKNTIVGAGSVVTKSFHKENITIAGNPARIVSER
mgnify:CR=1 FL=1